jgi:hypothetical protein
VEWIKSIQYLPKEAAKVQKNYPVVLAGLVTGFSRACDVLFVQGWAQL